MSWTPAILIAPTAWEATFGPSFPDKTAKPSSSVLSVTAQGATVEDLQAATAKVIADVANINQQIVNKFNGVLPDPTEVLFVLNDAEFAGAGDGHTFALTLTFLPRAIVEDTGYSLAALLSDTIGFPWESLLPGGFTFGFAIAGTGADASGMYASAVEQIAAKSVVDPFAAAGVFNMSAGAAKGTRIALCVGGIVNDAPPVPVPQPPAAALRAAPAGATASKAQAALDALRSKLPRKQP